MEHALRHAIHVRLEEDPVFYRSLRQRLEQIIEDKRARRIDAAEQLRLFTEVRREVETRALTAEDVGLSPTGLALYDLLGQGGDDEVVAEPSVSWEVTDEARKALAETVEESVAEAVGVVDWVHKDDVQREMRRRIKRTLVAARHAPGDAETLARNIVDLLRVREGR